MCFTRNLKSNIMSLKQNERYIRRDMILVVISGNVFYKENTKTRCKYLFRSGFPFKKAPAFNLPYKDSPFSLPLSLP